MTVRMITAEYFEMQKIKKKSDYVFQNMKSVRVISEMSYGDNPFRQLTLNPEHPCISAIANTCEHSTSTSFHFLDQLIDVHKYERGFMLVSESLIFLE